MFPIKFIKFELNSTDCHRFSRSYVTLILNLKHVLMYVLQRNEPDLKTEVYLSRFCMNLERLTQNIFSTHKRSFKISSFHQLLITFVSKNIAFSYSNDF